MNIFTALKNAAMAFAQMSLQYPANFASRLFTKIINHSCFYLNFKGICANNLTFPLIDIICASTKKMFCNVNKV
jgi:hypothetical protein